MIRLTILLATIALVVSAGAFAGSAYYWSERGTSYRCQGIASGATCRETNYYSSQRYGMSILPGLVTVTYGGRVIFGCEREFKPVANCEYYGP